MLFATSTDTEGNLSQLILFLQDLLLRNEIQVPQVHVEFQLSQW